MNQHVPPPDANPALMLRSLRRQARDTITRLLAFLDAIEDDPDLEDVGDDEPSLGSAAEDEHATQAQWADLDTEDREADEHDGREDGGDDEWSVGEKELENDLADFEPTLGWTADGSNGAPTDCSNDECEAGCPPTTTLGRSVVSDRLDNFTASTSFSRERTPYSAPQGDEPAGHQQRGAPDPAGITSARKDQSNFGSVQREIFLSLKPCLG